MIPILLPIGALLSGIGLLLLGTGLFNTLLPLRGSAEGFSDQTLGLLGSAYFAGFIIGTWLCPKLIRRMGHIRSFAFFAAATGAFILLHVLVIDAAFWFLLRVLTGVVLVGIYTVVESWLNTEAPAERRSQVFAVYMVVNLGALAAAQQLLRFGSPLASALFAVAAIFLMAAILPVTATRLPQPKITETPGLSLKRLWSAAPVAVAGSLLAGLALGGFWGLGAVYVSRLGLDAAQVASFMSLTILGGMFMQWPLGMLSDRMDRRRALAIVTGIAAFGGLLMAMFGSNIQLLLVAAAIFGGGAFAVYPTLVAHLIDHLHHDEILSGNAALLMLNGVGSAFGPAVAGFLMGITAPIALPLFFVAMFAACSVYAFIQARNTKDRIVEEPAQFVAMVHSSEAMLEMALDDQVNPVEREPVEQSDDPDDPDPDPDPVEVEPNRVP